MELLERDAAIFPTDMQWLYTGELVVSDEHDLADARNWDENHKRLANNDCCSYLGRLAVHPDVICDQTFSNTVVDLLTKTINSLDPMPTEDFICVVYHQLPETAPIRRLVVDFCVGDATVRYLEAVKKSKQPHEDLWDVMMDYQKLVERSVEGTDKVRWPAPAHGKRCDYRIHEEGVARCK